MLYTAVEEAPSAELTEPEILNRHFANFDDYFFQQCDQELKKINTFFSEKMAEATRKCTMLQSELKASLDASSQVKTSLTKARKLLTGAVPARKLQDLKLAFSEFYLSLILLQNYQNLNFTGFRKILKKHDKVSFVYHQSIGCSTYYFCLVTYHRQGCQMEVRARGDVSLLHKQRH
jgi:xenotropic and polytropic retrovirus receptor 1